MQEVTSQTPRMEDRPIWPLAWTEFKALENLQRDAAAVRFQPDIRIFCWLSENFSSNSPFSSSQLTSNSCDNMTCLVEQRLLPSDTLHWKKWTSSMLIMPHLMILFWHLNKSFEVFILKRPPFLNQYCLLNGRLFCLYLMSGSRCRISICVYDSLFTSMWLAYFPRNIQ